MLKMERRICRRCLLQQEIPEDIAEYLDRLIALIPEKERAEDSVREERVKICSSCEKRADAVCMACGCYIELRIVAAAQNCPYHKW